MSKTPKHPLYDNGQLHLSISKGNIKVGGIPQFNTLPGKDPLTSKKGELLTNIEGTCGDLCENCKATCYAIKCALFHHNSIIPAWAKNTYILRNDPEKVRKEINEFIKKNIVKYFRFHTSGEIENVAHLKLYCDICNDNPDVVFYMYTKNFQAIYDLFIYEGEEKPSNFVINLSEWHGNIRKFYASLDNSSIKFFNSLNEFAYDDGAEECGNIISYVHCPAVNQRGHETGVTCAMCRRCMTQGKRTAVYAH